MEKQENQKFAKNTSQKPKSYGKKIVSWILFILLVLLSYILGKGLNKSELKVERSIFPFTLLSKSNYACESVSNISTYEKLDYSEEDSFVILESTVEKGTDNLSIEVEGDNFYLLTRASIESGIAKPDEGWKILTNNKTSLVSIWTNGIASDQQTIDIFSLDKTTGIALWSRTRAQGFFTGTVPSGSMMHLKCL